MAQRPTHHDTWRPWVWAGFFLTTTFSAIFAFLSFATFKSFRDVTNDPHLDLPTGVNKGSWIWLFDGAAVSAFFALLLVILYVATTLYYMLFSRKSLSHPRSKYGKGFIVASSFFSALHTGNIATQFLSFGPAMGSWVSEYHAEFNRPLLTATWLLGYLSSLSLLIFTAIVVMWRDKDAETVERAVLSHSVAA